MTHRKTLIGLWIGACLIGSSAPAWAATYRVDKDRTSVSFKIRSFMSSTQGTFHDFQGTVEYDPEKPESWRSEGTIAVKSIDTKNAERDRHLLSKDFFDADTFQEISFGVLKIPFVEKDGARVEGRLKIRGLEKPVTLDVENISLNRDKAGVEHMSFFATTTLNRRDFGMTYGSDGPAKIMLGDIVTITLKVEAIRV